jgi:hypothetical protein
LWVVAIRRHSVRAADRPRLANRVKWRLCLVWPKIGPSGLRKDGAPRGDVEGVDRRANSVETADRLVVFGYSLPAIDVEAEKLFERAIAKNSSLPQIDVINPAHESAARFAEVGRSRPLRWYPSVTAMLTRDDFG